MSKRGATVITSKAKLPPAVLLHIVLLYKAGEGMEGGMVTLKPPIL